MNSFSSSRTIRHAAFGLALAASLSGMHPAQAVGADPIGSIISYQGKLSDAAGKPVADGMQSITFKVYEAGTEKSTQTITVATVGGVFNTFLSVGTLVFDPAKSYQLGITVGTGTEVLHPIAAVPVAVQAINATNAVDKTTAQTVAGVKTFSDVLKGTGGLLLSGAVGDLPATGEGVRLMWVPAKRAFRAGEVTGIEWDDASIGDTSIGMGRNAIASGDFSVAMGRRPTASGFASIAMGQLATASGDNSTALGQNTIASGLASTAMGQNTIASGIASTAMGQNTIASGIFATAMGQQTTAIGTSAMAMGQNTEASGDYSTAMGTLASTNEQAGSFVYGDRSTADNFTFTKVAAIAPNSATWRTSGGFRIYTSSDTSSTGISALLEPNSGSWLNTSDRNAKNEFAPINAREVLKKVSALPLSSWQYKGNASRHIGPMAQDFRAAFGLGMDDKHIATVDADGIALAAIQGLSAELQDRDTKIAALEAKNAAFEARLKKLEGHAQP